MAKVKDKLVTVETAKVICEDLAAPAGYGLGGNVVETDWGSVDYLKQSGWYKITNIDHIGGTSISRAVLRVDSDDDDFIIQTLWGFNNDTGARYQLQRHYTSAWHDWEWDNPPMNVNTEYVTTERYMGVPVKTQLVSCGTVTKGNTLTYAHGINISTLVRAEIIVGRQSLPFLYDGDLTNQYSITGYVNKDNVFVKNGSGNGQYEVYARIWYI